jgi:hypothetical protein
MAVLAIIPFAFLEWWSWRSLKSQAKRAQNALSSGGDYLEVAQVVRSAISTKISNWLASRSRSQENRILIHWFFAYITHPPALLVLAISLAAFVSCLFQLLLVNELRKAEPAFLSDVGNVEELIAAKIQNASALWVNGTNNQIGLIEFDINHNLLGWAQQSTQALNNTLNTCKFYFLQS